LRKEKANMDPRSFRFILVTLVLLALAVVFIIGLVLLGPRVSTEPYSKFALIGAAILFLALGILCTRMGRDGVIIGVILIISAVGMLILGILI
jgi:hypothetical protein